MKLFPTSACALALGTLALSANIGLAQNADATRLPMLAGTYYSWMSTDVRDAWTQGFTGSGVTITVVDDFKSSSGFYGNLGDGTKLLRHGEWTRKETSMIAPNASIVSQDFSLGRQVNLARGLNVLNLSYGMYAADGYSSVRWSAQESSIISYAKNGSAIISKAAGNDGIAIGGVNSGGQKDYLNVALVGLPTAIFVGALNSNGSTSQPATMASYSNFAGSNTKVQSQFLVVGVAGNQTGLYGTSFAAPIITGYSAILGSKFTKATPTQITNQLLTTARQDTVQNYSAAVYGRGEASLSRALSPVAVR
jgi:subtilisin family serine protease